MSNLIRNSAMITTQDWTRVEDDTWWLADPLEREGEGGKFKIGDFIRYGSCLGRIVNYGNVIPPTPSTPKEKRKLYYMVNWCPHNSEPTPTKGAFEENIYNLQFELVDPEWIKILYYGP